MTLPRLSLVVPAHDATATIGRTLASIRDGRDRYGGQVEVIVVDDGSRDGAALVGIAADHGALMVVHPRNRGMCAARNSGIARSSGAIVAILDADDALAPDWPETLTALLAEWPPAMGVCWSACVDSRGGSTVSDPAYEGAMTLDDMLAERRTGEYLPMFRGDYIRARGYADPGTRKSCGLLSYLAFLRDGPFWISPRVLRLYDDRRPGSVTSDWTRPDKAAESAACLERVMAEFGPAYRAAAPRVYGGKYLRLAIYRRLAGAGGAWRAFAGGARHAAVKETVGALVLLLAGPRTAMAAVGHAKRMGLVKRYG